MGLKSLGAGLKGVDGIWPMFAFTLFLILILLILGLDPK
jgi:hypothetical protein